MREEIETRLVNLALEINELCKLLDKSFLSKHLTRQIIRSATSAALNYGETQGAESKNNFIHKTSIVLKELRETKICILLLQGSIRSEVSSNIDFVKDECDQLVAMFHKTVISAKKNK